MDDGLVDTHDKGINGGIAAPQDGVDRVVINVEVDDLQAYLDKAESMGAKTVVPITEIPNMVTFAAFVDPAGVMTGLVKSEG